jgi:uncharacterized membrane protein
MSEIPPPSGGSYNPPPPPPGSSYTPPPPPPGGGSYNPPPPSGSSGSDRGLMIFLSYFGIFALIPLLTKKEDREIQWHAKNGLVLIIAWFVCWLAFTIMSFILPAGIRFIFSFVGCLLGLGFLIVDILAMVKAFGGGRMRLPVISDFADKM